MEIGIESKEGKRATEQKSKTVVMIKVHVAGLGWRDSGHTLGERGKHASYAKRRKERGNAREVYL